MGQARCRSRRWLSGAAAISLLSFGMVHAASADDLMPVKAPGAPAPMAIGGWLFSPTLFIGGVYNSNVNQTSNKVSAWGERVVPGFTASVDNGIHQTSIYGVGDFQNFNSSNVDHKTTVDGKLGFIQTYLPQPDLTFQFNGDFTRQSDVFGSAAFAGTPSPLSGTSGAFVGPVSISPQANSDRYNQFSGAVTASKKFGNALFFDIGFSAVNTQFDDIPPGTTTRNGTVYTVRQRTGFNLTPQLYVFIDPAVNSQQFEDSTRNSQGYRITAGVGTAARGLWLGEVFGGYQSQKNDIVGNYDSGVFGVRLGYSPTRFWDFRASIDESLGSSTIATTGLTGVASRVTTALVNVGYNGLPRGWLASARFGYVRTDFVNASRVDDGWLAGANLSYEIWRNLGLTLDYQFKSVDSNVAGQSFDQQVVSLGVNYRY